MGQLDSFHGGPTLCVIDSNNKVVLTSQSHCALLGRDRELVLGHDWQSWTSLEDLPEMAANLDRFFTDRTPFEKFGRLLRPDGTPVAVMAQCSYLFGDKPDTGLAFFELHAVDDIVQVPSADRFHCAEFVRDMTYELAALSGRHRLADLTRSLINASANAEDAVEMLARVTRSVKV